MNLDSLRAYCNSLPDAWEDIKWGHDLCFMIGDKMFSVTGFEPPIQVSLKVTDEEFEDLISRDGIVPAPYLARYKWVLVTDPNKLSKKEWEFFLKQSYELVKSKLPKKKAKKK